jgi:hypothetical protein
VTQRATSVLRVRRARTVTIPELVLTLESLMLCMGAVLRRVTRLPRILLTIDDPRVASKY